MAIKIYIDQGHNPRDYNTGAEGNGYFEQDITYTVGEMLYNLLIQDPRFEPKLSRNTPDELLGTSNATSLSARTNEANAFGADLFLSLHTNAAENPRANGSEAFVYSKSSPAYDVAKDILEELNLATGLRNRGVFERTGLYVLRKTNMPAILLELGFISNPEEAELMANSPGLFARGIYNGLVKYYG